MDKYSHSRVYSLSFLFPNKRTGMKFPEIVLTTSRSHSEFVERFLLEREGNIIPNAHKYLRQEPELVWRDEQQGLAFAPERRFGVRGCAYILEEDREVQYHFPLIASRDCALALTLHLLLHALDCRPHEVPGEAANTRQLITLDTRVDNDAPAGYGHAVGGYVYPDMRRWLSRVGSSDDPDPLKSVRKAMIAATAALNPEQVKIFAPMCRARVNEKGRFLLECAGNACDVAIYPDSDHGPDSDEPTRFGCHNLDWAPQQLTLLAGLAALHDLAARELG